MEFPNRKSIRLKEYDYSQPGAYFVTICSYKKELIFGLIKNGYFCFSEIGLIISSEIEVILSKQAIIQIPIYQIMPNHIHLIISIRDCVNENVGVELASTRLDTIPKFIQYLKSKVYYVVRKTAPDFFYFSKTIWQRNYYEHIIRDEKSYKNIWEYIYNNPLSWQKDEYFI